MPKSKKPANIKVINIMKSGRIVEDMNTVTADFSVGSDSLLEDIQKITIETDEENPIIIAEITSEEINTADGYRVRLTPKYD